VQKSESPATPEELAFVKHLQLEYALLQPAVRSYPEALASLLAEEFCEFGSSGRIYNRQETIDALSVEVPGRLSIVDFSVTVPAPGVAFVKYHGVRHSESGDIDSVSLRSSLWVLREGRWQMLFHQGTHTSA
jgi:hypothetical protein